MKKAEFLNYLKALSDTNARISNDMTLEAGHRALAAERFMVLLSILPGAENLEEEPKPENTAEGVLK